MIPTFGEKRNWRRYTIEFGAAMTLYVVSVIVTVRLYDRFEPQGAAALGLAMIPMVPTLLALWAFLRQFWRLDELQRRVVAESLVVAAGIVSFGSFAAGWVLVIMQPAHPVFHFVPLLLVLPALIGVWWPALYFVGRRYA